MVFNELDKWMLDIEDKKTLTPKERRLYMKLERVRDETWKKYRANFDKFKYKNELPCPKQCMERMMSPLGRTVKRMSDELGKAWRVSNE